MNTITNFLLDTLKEKYIVKNILDLKYQMEHKEKMNNVCKSINEMTCFIFHTVSIESEGPIQTHLIFHDKYDDILTSSEKVEKYIFLFENYEIEQYFYIAQILGSKEDMFLNTEEYLGLYDINIMN